MIPQEDECLVQATLKPIRIIAKVDKIWILDPDPNVVIHGGAEKTINCELE